MSTTCYFLLLNRTVAEREVAPMVVEVLAGRTDPALEILKGRGLATASALDRNPQTYFHHIVELAIETLEKGLTCAFMDELTPSITDLAEAWRVNVTTLVRGGLVLSLCTEMPGPKFSAVLAFEARLSQLITEHSPTALDISIRENPEFVEPTTVGLFQKPEAFVRREAAGQIRNEINPLLRALPTLPETSETSSSVQHFYTLVAASAENPDLAILKGYL